MSQNSFESQINLNVRGLPVSATLAINEKSAELRRSGKKIYRLGLGQSPFPVPEQVVSVLREKAHEKDYLPVKGLYDLRVAVARYHRRSQGIEASAEDVLIAPGSKELMFLLQLVYYGDLLIPTPSWVSYAPQAHIIGRHVRWLATHRENDWHLIPDELDRQCSLDPGKPRILILNYPSNPTGRTYSDAELRGLAEVAREHRVVLLSDEIYSELHHQGKHISIARYYPEGTIISSGLSKWCGAGGWRLGTFLFPPGLRKLLDAMAVVASETYTSTSAPIQYAAVRAFNGGSEIERYLWLSRRILDALGTAMTNRLKAAGLIVSDPHGAFYLFPDFSNHLDKLHAAGIMTSDQLCNKLLDDTGVAVLPGSVFGRPPEEMTMRLAYVDFDGALALKSAATLPEGSRISEDFLLMNCRDMLDAADLMCSWITNLAT
ncbi:MAG: pyridoxal phosphate-dependent aminotransferase [Cyclonatronaceae bacterium]